MIFERRVIAAVLMVCAVTACVHADMVPASEAMDAAPQALARACDRTDHQAIMMHSPDSLIGLTIIDPNILSVTFWPEANADVVQAGETWPPLQTLEDRQGSLGLCLYALISLGLFRSGHWVKKSSLSFVPEWYHNGGPWQIGHGHAVGPDLLCPATVVCFVQPDDRAEDSVPQYRLGTIVSLWRKSQFTPAVLASRGPPLPDNRRH